MRPSFCLLLAMAFFAFATACDCGGDRGPVTIGMDAAIEDGSLIPDSQVVEDAALPPAMPLRDDEWVVSFAGSGRAVETDAAGNVFVAGMFSGTTDFGGGSVTATGSTDVFVASYTSAGAYRWAETLGGTESHAVRSMDLRGDRIVVAGSFRGTTALDSEHAPLGMDAFFAVYDTSGDLQWSRVFGDRDTDRATSAAFDSEGNIYVAIEFAELSTLEEIPLRVSFNGSSLIARWSGDGVFRDLNEWDNIPTAPMIALSTDTIHLAGSYQGNPDFGGGIISSEDQDLYIFTLGRDYSFGWQNTSQGADTDAVRFITADESGRTWIGAEFRGELDLDDDTIIAGPSPGDAFLAVLDTDGAYESRLLLTGEGGEYIGAFDFDDAGGVYLTGAFTEEVRLGELRAEARGNQDMMVAAVDEGLQPRWVRSFGGTMIVNGFDASAGSDGDVFVVGGFGGEVDFGAGVLTADGANGEAFYLLKLRD